MEVTVLEREVKVDCFTFDLFLCLLIFLVSILALRNIELMVKIFQRFEADRIIGFPVAIMDKMEQEEGNMKWGGIKK